MNIQEEYLPKQRQSVYEKYMKQLGEKQTNLNLAEDALNLLKYNGIRPYYDEKETKLKRVGADFEDLSILKATLIKELQEDNFTDGSNAIMIVDELQKKNLL